MEETVNLFFGDEKVQETLRLHYQELLTSNQILDLTKFERAVVAGVEALKKLNLLNSKTIAFLGNTETAKQIRELFFYPERAEKVVRKRLEDRPEYREALKANQNIIEQERIDLAERRTKRANDRADLASLAMYNAFGAIQSGARTAWTQAPLGPCLLAGVTVAFEYFVPDPPSPIYFEPRLPLTAPPDPTLYEWTQSVAEYAAESVLSGLQAVAKYQGQAGPNAGPSA